MDDKRTKLGPTGPVRVPPGEARPDDPLLGQTLAERYRIVRRIGAGGMGTVYVAIHNLLEKEVALKVLHAELARKPDLVERFMQEAKAASRIGHENVIDISDFGTTPDGHVFFAMERLSGRDLHEEIARARIAGELLPWARSQRIFLQICGALAAAHRQGIVHRDLKPENVYLVEFLGDADFVKLLDFGIAKVTELEGGDRKLTRTGMLFGTPEYMAPEQARGEAIDARVDIYSMGCILYQLVTGRVPFEADNFMAVLHLHLTEPPPAIPAAVLDRIGAPRELAAVIERALAKDRAQRFQTADELASAVRAVCGEAPAASGASGALAAARGAGASAQVEAAGRATPASVEVVPAPAPGPAAGAGAGAGAGVGAGAPSGRIRTQWSGNLSVPLADEPPAPRRRGKLPLVLGGLALAGVAAAVTVMLSRRGGGAHGSEAAAPAQPASTAAPAPATATSPSQPARPEAPAPAVAAAAPVSSPPPDEAPLPAKVMVTLDSQPRGAIVKDLVSGVVFGPTPRRFPVTPGRKPRQYLLTMRGYADAQVELVPDRERIEHTEALVKVAAAGRPATAPQSTRPSPDTPQLKPPPGTPPDDDCPELPCLKADPTRRGSGAGGGRAP